MGLASSDSNPVRPILVGAEALTCEDYDAICVLGLCLFGRHVLVAIKAPQQHRPAAQVRLD
jgi:hypothetical protein